MSEPKAARMRGLAAAFAIDLAVVLATMFGVMLVCGIVWAVAQGVGHASTGAGAPQRVGVPGPLAQVASTFAAMGAAALALLLWRRRPSAQAWRQSLAAARQPATWGLALLAAAITGALVVAIGLAANASGLHPDPSNDAVIRALVRQHPLLLWLFVAGLAPMYEEVLFRRGIYGRFAEAGRPRLGVAISAALFAFAHEIPGTGDGGVADGLVLWSAYAVMGAVFAWTYRRTGTLWSAILAHALHNALSLLML
ncbi:MAG: lysostaphin resistance A-like protein [Lysobacteraceae bacterium]